MEEITTTSKHIFRHSEKEDGTSIYDLYETVFQDEKFWFLVHRNENFLKPLFGKNGGGISANVFGLSHKNPLDAFINGIEYSSNFGFIGYNYEISKAGLAFLEEFRDELLNLNILNEDIIKMEALYKYLKTIEDNKFDCENC